MDQQVGSGSLCFAKAPFIIGTASVVGTKEGEGPLADAFDCIGPDDNLVSRHGRPQRAVCRKKH